MYIGKQYDDRNQIHITPDMTPPTNSASHLGLLCLLREISSKNGQTIQKKVQVGKDQEKAQSEKDSHSKNRGGKKPN